MDADRKQFLAVFSAQLLVVLPIVLAGRLYIDDLWRAAEGERAWSAAGRPLADLLFWLANVGDPAVTVFPLYQIISAAFVALAGVLLARLFGLKQPIEVAVAVFPLGAQPYFLQNYSYAFDTLNMSAGLLCAVAAAYLVCSQTRLRDSLFAALLLLAALMLYQPVLTAYLLVGAAAPVVVGASDNQRRQLVTALMVAAFAVLAYKVLIPVDNSYHAEKLRLWPLPQLVPGVVSNLQQYWRMLIEDWRGSMVGWNIFLICLLGLVLSLTSKTDAKASVGYFAKISVFPALVLFGCLVFSYGLSLLLEKPVFAPRVMLGFGVVITLMNLVILKQSARVGGNWAPRLRAVLRAPVYLLAYGFLVVAFAYGQASAAQKYFANGFYARMVYDLSRQSTEKNLQKVSFIGQGPKSLTLLNSERKFPVLASLVRVHIDNDRFWGSHQLAHHGLDLQQTTLSAADKASILQGQRVPVVSTKAYQLFVLGDILIVRFLSDHS